ncbi:FUSC family protein [Gluconacetobacter tumulisoli]|uniref:FUSC family protein n=1 Tax=Gluconacetobacter tumulisoli TaxID=1286189 RepID=A0A7W4PKY4_9PROT|nr:FUSC family protein [Gluconacetobacter tumulisoli]MBB2200094.1 FUSC family protein [Gluconacetobacter tumulisoli]
MPARDAMRDRGRTRLRRLFGAPAKASRAARLGHWLGMRAILVAPEQVGLREGLRSAIAVGVMMGLATAWGRPLMAWSAFAAFWTCLVDPGGPRRPRLRAMVLFGIVGTVLAGLMSCVAGMGLAVAFPMLATVTFLCGLARGHGAAATQVGVLAAIVGVVAVCYPMAPSGALMLAGLFALGAGWALAICVLAWPVDPYAPARRATAALLREEAGMAYDLLDRAGAGPAQPATARVGAYRRAIRARIERTRGMVGTIGAEEGGSPVRRALSAGIEAGDRIFVALIAMEHDRAAAHGSGRPADRRALRRIVAAIVRTRQQVLRVDPDHVRMRRLAVSLRRQARTVDGVAAQALAVCGDALQELADAWERAAEAVAGAPDGGGRTPAGPSHASGSPPGPWWRRIVLPHAARHAARLSVAVVVAYGLTILLGLPYAYWATMAVVVVMQPQAATTGPRMVERMLGSVAGGIMAAILGASLPMAATLLLIFPLAAATIALRSVNYTLFVLFLTPLFVLVTDLGSPGHGWGVALARAVDNVLGSVVGLLGCLVLWPERTVATFPGRLAEAVGANMRYLALVADPAVSDTARIDAARRDAGVASTAAEIARQRLRLEGLRRSAQLDLAADLLLALRQVAGMASVAWLERMSGQARPDGDRAAAYAAIGAAMAARLRGKGPAGPPVDGTDLPSDIAHLVRAADAYAVSGAPAVRDSGKRV